jgi:hypothetical protein
MGVALYEWLLFLHVVAAFITIAAVVAFGVVVVGVRRAAAPADARAVLRLSPLATVLWNVGGGGVLILGVWLALNVDGYELWDGWILAAIVLWFVASAGGGPLARDHQAALDATAEGDAADLSTIRSSRSLILYGVASLATVALLVDMILKPGA